MTLEYCSNLQEPASAHQSFTISPHLVYKITVNIIRSKINYEINNKYN